MLRDSLVEELRDLLLAAPQGRAGQRMWVDLDEAGLASRYGTGHLIGKPPYERRLSGARLTGKNDQSMDGHGLERKLLAQLERQQRLRHQPLTDGRGELDCAPRRGEVGMGKSGLVSDDVHRRGDSLTSQPLGGNGSLPWESRSRMRPFLPWMKSSVR